METVKIFNYNNASISFKMGECTMINATQMAKPFGKKPNDYLRLPSTNELVSAIARKSRTSENQLVKSNYGSPENGGGTWLHEDVALDFAQWLSVDFKLWCNDRIKELLLTGHTTIKQNSCQWDEDRNILPGIHKPKSVMIDKQMVWTIQMNGEVYYRLKDIMVGAEIYDYVRKMTSKPQFKHYVFWFNDQSGTRPKRYVNENGVNTLLEKTKDKYEKAPTFLKSFNDFNSTNTIEPANKEDNIPENRNKNTINLNAFLDIIGKVEDNEDRLFLFDLYRKLKKNEN